VRVQASRELLAPRPDVWDFLGEPFNLADWWPGISGVQPDRRGSAAGARWQVTASYEPTLLRRPQATGTLVVTASDRPVLFAFHLTGEKLDVRVDLEATASDRTRATITVEGPWLIAFRRTLARRAAGRLYGLCQTAASS
jgi:carbon monoxide dehydrogenase subunit G